MVRGGSSPLERIDRVGDAPGRRHHQQHSRSPALSAVPARKRLPLHEAPEGPESGRYWTRNWTRRAACPVTRCGPPARSRPATRRGPAAVPQLAVDGHAQCTNGRRAHVRGVWPFASRKPIYTTPGGPDDRGGWPSGTSRAHASPTDGGCPRAALAERGTNPPCASLGRPPALDFAEGSERVRIICGPLLGGQPHDRMNNVRSRSPVARSR
jgi:hypothetical protein